MASSISSFRPEAASQLAQLVSPVSSAADVAALAAVGLASAAYLLRGIAWDKPNRYHHVWFERPQLKHGGTAAAPRRQPDRNIAQKLEESNIHIVVFWGSQSGTAEAFANRLARECHLRFGVAALAADLSDYDPESIALIPNSKLAIFILSTFGEGDPSDNTTPFWEWLQRGSSEIRMPNLRYMALGLGNSSYRHYNRVVDMVTRALNDAGAQRLMDVGRADDANGSTEEDFLSWKDRLHTFFHDKLGFQERQGYTPSFAVTEDRSLSRTALHHGEPVEQRNKSAKAVSAYSQIKALAIQTARELCTSSSSEAKCLHLELDLSNHPELRYRTGDHLVVYPINPDEEVRLLLRALGLETRPDVPLRITSLENVTKPRIPSPTTALALFRHYLEVCAPVSRDTVRGLAQFAPTSEARDLLASLGQTKEAYAAFVRQHHHYITVGRLLSMAAPGTIWNGLPLCYLIETIPPLQPRHYSISSSSLVSPRRVALTVAVGKVQPPDVEHPKEIRGLTTNYLVALADSLNCSTRKQLPGFGRLTYDLPGPAAQIFENHHVFACVRRSKFKLPARGSIPLVMVCAGTGIASFRGFILERVQLKAIGKPVGRMLLFFGCRHPEQDHLYREELAKITAKLDGCLEIITAFSAAHGRPKTYVQDCLIERGDEVCDLLTEGANLYICGRATMAREVGKVVEEQMGWRNGWVESKVQNWTELAKKRGKWLEDVWG